MFDTVKQHGEDIEKLKEADRRHDERLKQLETNALKLENTVMQENRDTRSTMVQQTEKLFSIVDKAMGYQSDEAKHKHEQRMAKINASTNVILKLLLGFTTAGGTGYIIIQHLIDKFGGN
ncbi:hypothetical protein ACFOZY_03240 [Chungangia koreensis]|uniref:TMhelix containing protein n=1 Tax=Chungangia koreensis TaxID=752657 RepID=A0ABV8X0M3_9LACT